MSQGEGLPEAQSSVSWLPARPGRHAFSPPPGKPCLKPGLVSDCLADFISPVPLQLRRQTSKGHREMPADRGAPPG